MPFHLQEGTCYLIEGKPVATTYRLFRDLLQAGMPGLCVSRVFPDHVRSRYGIGEVPIWWISQSPGDDHFGPTALGSLAHALERFIGDHPKGCVLLVDGIEFLQSYNEFSKTLFFVDRLNEFVMSRRAIVLMPVDPDCFNAMEFARLERFLSVLREADLRRDVSASEIGRTLLGS